jgi:hypothetical protein
MSLPNIELTAAHGDETIGAVRFVVHGATMARSAEIARDGLSVVEGQAIVSTNLLQAYAHATQNPDEPGLINVIAVPNGMYLGYAAFSTAYISRSTKTVIGAPLRFAAARKQLAFYLDPNTEAARARVEAKVLGGSPFTDHPSYPIEMRNVLGSFAPTQPMLNTITALDVSAKAFEPYDSAALEGALIELFDCREAAQAVLVPTMVHDLVVTVVESVILSRLRIMRWQGLALLGYKFQEASKDVAVTRVENIAQQRRLMSEYRTILATSSIFNGELAWLKVYINHQLELMRVELDGAELAAA